MTYEIMYGQLLTRIDVFHADGRWARTVYVHQSEYRTWEASVPVEPVSGLDGYGSNYRPWEIRPVASVTLDKI